MNKITKGEALTVERTREKEKERKRVSEMKRDTEKEQSV